MTFENKLLENVIKLQPYWIRVDLNPMAGILIWAQIHRKENTRGNGDRHWSTDLSAKERRGLLATTGSQGERKGTAPPRSLRKTSPL